MHRDAGLQPERTARARDRTALARAANAALVARSGLQANSAALLCAGVALLGLAVALAGVGLARRRQLARARPVAPRPVLIGLTSAAALLAAVCGAWGLLLQQTQR